MVKTEKTAEPPERKPPGHNRAVVLTVLDAAGGGPLTQARIIRDAAKRGEDVAQSSVRHALHQLKREGKVRPVGRSWQRVSSEEETAGHPTTDRPAASSNTDHGGSHGPALA